jgi:hypothetical protein
MCGIYRPLNLITDIDALTGVPGATIGSGHRALKCCPRWQCLKQLRVWSLA